MFVVLQKNAKAAARLELDHLWSVVLHGSTDEIDEIEEDEISDQTLKELGGELAIYQGKRQKDGGPPKALKLVKRVEKAPDTAGKLKELPVG